MSDTNLVTISAASQTTPDEVAQTLALVSLLINGGAKMFNNEKVTKVATFITTFISQPWVAPIVATLYNELSKKKDMTKEDVLKVVVTALGS